VEVAPCSCPGQVPAHCVPTQPAHHGGVRHRHGDVLPVGPRHRRQVPKRQGTPDDRRSDHPHMRGSVFCGILYRHDGGDQGAAHAVQALPAVPNPQHRVDGGAV